jgi:lauroyl/myristoyl acyltransferase
MGTAMNHLSWFQRQWIAWDYDVLLPLLARLPLSWGRRLAGWRGLLYAKLQRDWRQFSFQDNDLHIRTQQALHQLLPEADTSALTQAVARRYQLYSIEEWEAACIIHRDISRWPLIYEGLDDILDLLQDNPRIVFISAHFGSCVLGSLLLQRLGIPILGMVSNITEDPRIHPSISYFFRKKYAAMARYLNGGQALDRESNTLEFVRFLQHGGAVVIFGDLPGLHIQPFLGSSCGLASGPVKLAKIAHTPLMAFVCEFNNGSYYLRFSAPGEDSYVFLDQAIRRNPCAWYAADQLPLMQKD